MFNYFLKLRLRNKAFVFWCLVFPLALMTCFKIAFGNLTTNQDIDTKEVAVIYENESSMYANGFSDLINNLTQEDTNGDDALFHLNSYSTEDEVRDALINGDLDLAFKVYDDKVETLLPKAYTDTACAVGKAVANSYMNNYDMIATAFETNPMQAQALLNSIGEDLDFVNAKESDFVDESPNPYIWYFYSSLVMGIFFNANNGTEIIADIKADSSTEGMRVSVSPKEKSKLIAASYSSCLLVAVVINIIQLLVMKYIFEVPMGGSILKLACFILATNIFAIAFGIVCACLFKGSKDTRANKTTSIIMASVFLSGEMIAQLPGILETSVPLINDINPATVMNMALFRLAYSTGDFDFYINMIKIVVMAIICLVISVIILRREKYASV